MGRESGIPEEEFPDFEGEGCPQCRSQSFDSQLPVGTLALVVLTQGLIAAIFRSGERNARASTSGNTWRN